MFDLTCNSKYDLKSGIYQIKCLANNKVYIGQSIDLNNRYIQHISALRKNNHENYKLQKDFNFFKENNFEFNILSVCPQEMLNHLEDFYIKKYDSVINGYNLINGTMKYRPKGDQSFEIYENEVDKFIKKYINNFYDTDNLDICNIKDLYKEFNLFFYDDISIDFIKQILIKLNLGFFNKINDKYIESLEISEYCAFYIPKEKDKYIKKIKARNKQILKEQKQITYNSVKFKFKDTNTLSELILKNRLEHEYGNYEILLSLDKIVFKRS